jgi:hypothetical protein
MVGMGWKLERLGFESRCGRNDIALRVWELRKHELEYYDFISGYYVLQEEDDGDSANFIVLESTLSSPTYGSVTTSFQDIVICFKDLVLVVLSTARYQHQH